MKRFTFDVKMFTTVTVKAPDDVTAERWIRQALDGRDMGLAFTDEGVEVALGESYIDGGLDLVEEGDWNDDKLPGDPDATEDAEDDDNAAEALGMLASEGRAALRQIETAEEPYTPSNPHGASKRTYTQQIEYDEQQKNDDE